MVQHIKIMFCTSVPSVSRQTCLYSFSYKEIDTNVIHCKKKFNDFPVPSQDVTHQTLRGREKFNYSRPGRVGLVTSRLGTRKSVTFFTVYMSRLVCLCVKYVHKIFPSL
jgi:hypothetical protein